MFIEACGLVQIPFVLVKVYVPGVVTVIDGVVSPVDQVFPVALLEVRMILPPGQSLVVDEDIEEVKLLSLKTIALVCLQELAVLVGLFGY